MKNQHQVVKEINKIKNTLYRDLLYSAYKSTICFFREDNKRDRVAAGSGLLIKFKNSTYVVTAAHVFGDSSDELFIILPEEELFLGGREVSTIVPETGSRSDDKIDLSVIKIDKFTEDKLLKRYNPLDFDEIELNHLVKNEPSYFLIGFPQTRTKKVWNKNEIKSQAYTYHSEPFLDYNYQKYGFNKNTTIAIKYDGDVTSARIPYPHLSPKLEGMSGSGCSGLKK